MTFKHDVLILDACCVLTLYASGRMDDILRSIPPSVTVAAYVYEEEILYVYAGPQEDIRSAREPVKLDPLIETGLLTVAFLESPDEILSYVNLSSRLDDGEAATIALALCRGWAVATDDKKAIALLKSNAPPNPQVFTTPELLKHWAEITSATQKEIADVLRAVYLRSVYQPGRKHPLFTWWQSYIS